jgi:hypothetical protein
MPEPTRDERKAACIGRHMDKAVGLLMRSYADARPLLSEKNDEKIGRAMLAQMRAARELIGEVFDDLFPAPKDPPPQPPVQNGQAQTPARKA